MTFQDILNKDKHYVKNEKQLFTDLLICFNLKETQEVIEIYSLAFSKGYHYGPKEVAFHFKDLLKINKEVKNG